MDKEKKSETDLFVEYIMQYFCYDKSIRESVFKLVYKYIGFQPKTIELETKRLIQEQKSKYDFYSKATLLLFGSFLGILISTMTFDPIIIAIFGFSGGFGIFFIEFFVGHYVYGIRKNQLTLTMILDVLIQLHNYISNGE